MSDDGSAVVSALGYERSGPEFKFRRPCPIFLPRYKIKKKKQQYPSSVTTTTTINYYCTSQQLTINYQESIISRICNSVCFVTTLTFRTSQLGAEWMFGSKANGFFSLLPLHISTTRAFIRCRDGWRVRNLPNIRRRNRRDIDGTLDMSTLRCVTQSRWKVAWSECCHV